MGYQLATFQAWAQGKRQVLRRPQQVAIRYDPGSMISGLTRPPEALTNVGVSTIDSLLNKRLGLLRLPAPLESRFMRDHTTRRLNVTMASGVVVAFLYNWILVADAVMIPDQFDLAVMLRMFVFTPVTLLLLLMVSRLPLVWVREGMIMFSGILAAGISTYLCVTSQHPNAGPYLVCLAVVVVFSNTVARIRFGLALLVDIIVFGLFVWGSLQITSAPYEVMLPAGVMMLSLSVFTLYGCLTLELDERRTWLIRLRERRLREELMQANAQLNAASRHDALTSLPNRHHFEDTLAVAWQRAQAAGQPLSMILLDLDHFRAFNTVVGQDEGDECLQRIATMLKRHVSQPEDFLARYGGEEFALLQAGQSITHAAAMAQRIRSDVEALQVPHPLSPTTWLTVSVGVASMRPDAPHATAAQLIAAADEALRQAKQQGGNAVFAFGTDG